MSLRVIDGIYVFFLVVVLDAYCYLLRDNGDTALEILSVIMIQLIRWHYYHQPYPHNRLLMFQSGTAHKAARYKISFMLLRC
jgi:hypothetical protein